MVSSEHAGMISSRHSTWQHHPLPWLPAAMLNQWQAHSSRSRAYSSSAPGPVWVPWGWPVIPDADPLLSEEAWECLCTREFRVMLALDLIRRSDFLLPGLTDGQVRDTLASSECRRDSRLNGSCTVEQRQRKHGGHPTRQISTNVPAGAGVEMQRR
jgi:hypothetical protein